MGKNIGAHDGLRAADVAPRRASDNSRQRLKSRGVDIGATARDVTKRHDDFLKRGVAGALTQPKHRHGSVQGARADRRQRIGRRKSHVGCVPVKLDRQVRFFPHALDQFISAERIEKAQGVRETKTRGALLRGCAQNTPDVRGRRARSPRHREQRKDRAKPRKRRRVSPVPPRHRRRRQASRQSASATWERIY